MYIVEDLHTMWMGAYGKGAELFIANMINDIHREFHSQPSYNINSLHLYNSLAVIKKGSSILGPRLTSK